MNRFFYGRLAAVNIRKNGRIYIPYILTCIFMAAMFYIMLFITLNDGLTQIPGSGALGVIMWMGTVVIGIFSVIILMYTNSFLMKRRKKELGLYNILGMGKPHIARVMTLETLYVALITVAAGLSAGILLSKLILMLLLKLLKFQIPFGFEISPIALIVTVVVFSGILFITLLCNLGRIHLSKPIELLYGGSVGEKEPKTKWILALLGALALATGYTIAIIVEKPTQALGWFFIAVILVIFGTYFLFTAGSIAVLKVLRKNKRYYYKTAHFTTVSGMIYRMKQNAVGLGNICILSTMVLVMLSTTVSLYIGMEDALRNRFPRDIQITATRVIKEDCTAFGNTVDTVIADSGIPVTNVTSYRYKSYTLIKEGPRFLFSSDYTGTQTENAVVYFVPLDAYNTLSGSEETLAGNELLMYAYDGSYTEDTVSFSGLEFTVKNSLMTIDIQEDFSRRLLDVSSYFIIVRDDQTSESIHEVLTGGNGDWQGVSYYYGFDTGADAAVEIALTARLGEAFADIGQNDSDDRSVYVTSAEQNRDEFLSIYGGLFFLGLFLGTLFIMATVIIMYYKQISEGYDDKKRFEIMQKVGLSHAEIKKTIRSQVLTVFFLPLVAAGIHILAAFKMITRLLFMLNLTNVQLFALCTLGTIVIFAVIYSVVYTLTARSYYKIVS